MVTTEFAPIGLLSRIASDIDESPSMVGLAVTLYAWIGAASGLLSSWVSHRISRKALLISLMLILAASSVLAALSSDLSTLLGARALGAIAHGVFWASVAATAAQMVPEGRVGLATSIVLGGITVATVMGVPLVNLIGQYVDWRTAFGCLAGMSALCAGALAWMLPPMHLPSSSGASGFMATIRRRDLRVTYVITGLTAAAHFGAYTFIEPFLSAIPGISAYAVAVMLFAFGAAGFAGNLLSALLIDRHLRVFIFMALVGMALAIMALGLGGPTTGVWWIVGLLIVWGMTISALFTGLQTWVLSLAGEHTVPATAIHTAVLNAAIGVGVIVGGGALESVGIDGAMLSASLVILPAIVLMVASGRRGASPAPAREAGSGWDEA